VKKKLQNLFFIKQYLEVVGHITKEILLKFDWIKTENAHILTEFDFNKRFEMFCL